MAPEDNHEDKGQETVRQTIWPAFQPMTQSREENSQEKQLAGDMQQQQQQANTSSVEDERTDVSSASIKRTIDETKPANGFQYQNSIDSGRTDEERRQAFLADLYEGPYVNIGRPILVPVSRLARTKLHDTSARICDGSPVDRPSLGGSCSGSPGALVGPAALDNTRASSTPIHLRTLSVGEAPRSNKTIRLEKEENAGMDLGPMKPSPGAGNPLSFDPSPKNLLALGMNGKNLDSAQSGLAMDIDEIKAEPAPSTPSPPPSRFQREDGSYSATPDRPRTAKTTPAALFPYEDTEAEESPTLRLQMGRLRVTSSGASNSGPVAGSGYFDRPGRHAHGPHPYCLGYPVPRTPTKGKRARGEFEKTTTLSGRDVAREREILARFAAAIKDEDEEEEKEEGEVERDEEDEGELTPKASILNRHMDIDEK